MLLERDADTGASYVVLDDAADVVATQEVTDLVNVDFDASGRVVGVELAMRQERITENIWQAVVGTCPDLKAIFPDVDALRCLRESAA